MDAALETDRRLDASTDRPSDDSRAVLFLTFGPGYRVIAGDGTEHIVDVEQETCTSEGDGGRCAH